MVQKHLSYCFALRKSNPAANLCMSCYFSVVWCGKQREGEDRRASLFFFPFLLFSEGRALKINGPDSGKEKKIWDSDHLPDGGRQSEALTGPS